MAKIRTLFRSFTERLKKKKKIGVTLIELLIAIGLVAVLSVVIAFVIQPQEFLKRSRDGRRLSELKTLHSALGIVQADAPNTFTGTSSIVYTSLIDPAATTTAGTDCSGLGLPAVPPGFTWHCAASSTATRVDGTGWIPVNFTAVPSKPPIARLPLDPLNTPSLGNYYTYVTGGSWELTAALEAKKNMTISGVAHVASIGTHEGLTPGTRGDSELRGYWSLNEGSGSSARDAGPYANHGTMSGATWTSSGKQGAALSFNGGHVNIPHASSLNPTTTMTVAAWVKAGESGSYKKIAVKSNIDDLAFYLSQGPSPANVYFGIVLAAGGSGSATYNQDLPLNEWTHMAGVYTGSQVQLYLNGTLATSSALAGAIRSSPGPMRISGYANGGEQFNGVIDEVYLYGRALSAAEIQNLYTTTR